jgi:hypothetical protein
MESLVVTLETAKKLKASGFPQDCHFEYWIDMAGAWQSPRPTVRKPTVRETHAAPTAQEIADQLREGETEIAWFAEKWHALCRMHDGPFVDEVVADTMAEALALLWIRLKGVA